LLNENNRRESLLPKEEIKNCIAGFSVRLTSGSGKFLFKKICASKFSNRFFTSLQEKNSLSSKKNLMKNFSL